MASVDNSSSADNVRTEVMKVDQVDAKNGSNPGISTNVTEIAQTTITPDGIRACPTVEIKLFAGRVPRTIDEPQLKPIFEEFGSVLEVIIIKDRQSGSHKGSAFIRMASITQSDAAVRGLNNVRILDKSLGALQVRYANGEAERLGLHSDAGTAGQDEAKLFVGSLPKTVTEDEIRPLFEEYGQVKEIFVIKDMSTGMGRGCAFVKFGYKEQALNAIEKLNQKMTMNGSNRPMDVRFAEHKKSQANVSNNVAVMPQMNAPMNSRPMVSPAVSNQNPRQAGPWKEYFSSDGRPYYHCDISGITQWDTPVEFQFANPANGGAMGGPAGKSTPEASGPPGANIFVFHVPNDWTNTELTNAFGQFGRVISAHIATDKSTRRNRGFAFVSYDDVKSAVAAVTHMNGFMAHGKRLKVSIKTGEESYVRNMLPPQGSTPTGQGPPQGMPGQVAPQMGMTPVMGGQMGQAAPISGPQQAAPSATSPGYGGFPGYAVPHGIFMT